MFTDLGSCDRCGANPSFIPDTSSNDNGRGCFDVHQIADGLPLFLTHFPGYVNFPWYINNCYKIC